MKPIIYQVLPRLFGNRRPSAGTANTPHGTITQNGSGKFSHFTPQVLDSLHRAGYTHIWYTGILCHATATDYSPLGLPATHPAVVKGAAGSPYAIRDYYDVDPDLADDPAHRFEEFAALIARTHAAGLKVIIDFVPNHVARNYHSVSAPAGVRDLGADDRTDRHFSPANNFYYCVGESFNPAFDRSGYIEYPARATGNDCFSSCPTSDDWYETVKLNYGIDYLDNRTCHFDPIPDTWHKMVEILEFWTTQGIDGFRCDMAEMVPAEFWHWAVSRIRALNPDITFIAEIYNPAQYRHYISYGGFDYLYDKVGLYDTLHSIVRHHSPASSITYAWQAVDNIRPHMLSFLENHDEIRIASDITHTQDTHLLAQRGYTATAIAALMSTGAVMIYAGQEVGETADDAEGFSGHDGHTTIFDYWRVDKLCRLQQKLHGNNRLHDDERQLLDRYRRLTQIASTPTITDGNFYDLMWLNTRNPQFNPDNTYAFIRYTGHDIMLVVANFTDYPATIGITLADHLFETTCLPPADHIQAVDLFTKKLHDITFTPSSKCMVDVPANDIVCLQFTL